MLLLSTFLFSGIEANAQLDDNKAKAVWIFNIASQIEWEEDFDELEIGVLSSAKVFEELRKMSENKKISGKPVKIKYLKRYKKIGDSYLPHILYVDRRENLYIDIIFRKILGTKIFLITDRVHKTEYTMLNFVSDKESKKPFIINDKSLHTQKFKLSKALLKLGGSESLLRELYSEIEIELKKEKEELERQKEMVLHQKSLLDSLQEEVLRQRADINTKELQIREKEKELRHQAEKFAEVSRKIRLQKRELDANLAKLKKQEKELEDRKQAIHEQKKLYLKQKEKMDIADKELKNKQLKIKDIDAKLSRSIDTVKKKEQENTILYALLGLIAVLTFIVIREYYKKRKTNRILQEQNISINTQKQEIQTINDNLKAQSSEIEHKNRELAAKEKILEQSNEELQTVLNQVNDQKAVIQRKNEDITGSMNYAKRIQDALLGNTNTITNTFREAFVVYKPHSIISGDFYWFADLNDIDIKIVVAADCTGHGVPGAFMTVIGHNLLDEIILSEKVYEPAEILNKMDSRLNYILKKDNKDVENVNDGMDLSISIFNKRNGTMKFSGAKSHLLIFREEEMFELKGSIFPIGGHNLRRRKKSKFKTVEFTLNKNDMLYVFSDGFQDQLGGPRDRKYMKRRFYNFLSVLKNLPVDEQTNKLEEEHKAWKQNKEQTDDILIIGMRI